MEQVGREMIMQPALATSLFEKLGGSPAIEAVVRDFYKRVLGDPDLQGFFAKTDMDKQTRSQIAFLTMALGGPNNYDGRPMKEAHDGMGITDMHFDKVAGHLVAALKDAGVCDEDVNEVVALVGPLKKQIVSA